LGTIDIYLIYACTLYVYINQKDKSIHAFTFYYIIKLIVVIGWFCDGKLLHV